MAKQPLPDASYLKECFDYNPHTGILIWKIRPARHFKKTRGMRNFNSNYAGKIAGTKLLSRENSKTHYIRISCFSFRDYAHRIIWKIMTGVDAEGEIDHANRNGLDNSWSNLRDCSHSQNACNKVQKCGVSGKKGVWKKRNKWQAYIKLNGLRHNLGVYDTVEEAYAAYCAGSEALHKEFGNVVSL